MTHPDLSKTPDVEPPPMDAALNDRERAVIAALRDIAFGEIEVIVHHAKIVQITRSKKFRFNSR